MQAKTGGKARECARVRRRERAGQFAATRVAQQTERTAVGGWRGRRTWEQVDGRRQEPTGR
eukprot:1110644-Prymnesium_polylepis.1